MRWVRDVRLKPGAALAALGRAGRDGELIGPPTHLPDAESAFTPASGFGRILTRREADVMQIVATGASNVRIADQLMISEETVKCHMRSTLRRLRCANRGEAISRYLGLVDGQPGSRG